MAAGSADAHRCDAVKTVSESRMTMRAYPHYRESGVEWLGELPKHWKVGRLKWSIAETTAGVWGHEPDGENDIACVRVADFDRPRLRVNFDSPTLRAINPAQRNGRQLLSGDLLLERSGGGERQMVGCVVYFDHDKLAVSSNFIARIVSAPDAHPKFWTYVHAALYAGKLNYPAIKQTTGIQNLDANAYFDTLVGFPPLDEQNAIATFLDRETERIDALVEKKRLLIERLEEYRTALITRTVTRGLPPEAALAAGLDPSPRLKPSGVEWLGDVPEYWEVYKPSMGFAKIGSGTTPRSDSDEYYEGETPWVTTSELREETIFETAKSISKVALREHPTLRLYPVGALVIAMYGATIGRLGILGVPATVNQACCVFAGETRLRARFVYYWLIAFREVLVSRSAGGGQPNLSQEDLRSLRIPAPAISEQDRIVGHLAARDAALRRLSADIKSAVERLQEHRTALVTAAVTGKIDVRGPATAPVVAT